MGNNKIDGKIQLFCPPVESHSLIMAHYTDKEITDILRGKNTRKAKERAFERDEVLFHGPATIINSCSGEKTVVRCAPEDTFDPKYGYLLCKVLQLSGVSHKRLAQKLKEVEEKYQRTM